MSPGPGDGREYTVGASPGSGLAMRLRDLRQGLAPCGCVKTRASTVQFYLGIVCYVTCACIYSAPLLHWCTTSSWVC